MASNDEENLFGNEIQALQSMFGDLVSTAVIVAVLESCNGDVNIAAEAIVNITCDDTEEPENEGKEDNIPDVNNTAQEISNEIPCRNNSPVRINVTPTHQHDVAKQIEPPSILQEVVVPSVSYAQAFHKTGAVPKQFLDDKKNCKPVTWSKEIRNIIQCHSQGNRILIILRGVPGSGKSYLAKHLVDITVGASSNNYYTHIFSSDDYFMCRGRYNFNRSLLPEAHMTTQRRVCTAANQGLSPIIVDNTNVELWEMEPYARDGVRNGYHIEIVEVKTPWARNLNQLTKKNAHGVPRESIKRMLENYQSNITIQVLLKSLRISYPPNRIPPVKRSIPPVCPVESTVNTTEKESMFLQKVEYVRNDADSKVIISPQTEVLHHENPKSPEQSPIDEIKARASQETEQQQQTNNDWLNKEEESKLQKLIEAQKQLDQLAKVEQEWESGEKWDDIPDTNAPSNTVNYSQNLTISLQPKPPRNAEKNHVDNIDNFIEPAKICDDWTKISMFMPSWQDDVVSNDVKNTENPIQTSSNSTCFEIDDWQNVSHKIMYATTRDINEAHMQNNNSNNRIKVPKEGMLDKSTTTHEHDIFTETQECKNKEKHFSAFRRMFKHVPRPELRDVFDNCRGDVNWAVNIVLDSYPGNQPISKTDTTSDNEDEINEECQCLAAYNIIPHVSSTSPATPVSEMKEKTLDYPTPVTQKKVKRERNLSEGSMQLKRQIESNVVIPDNHYSQHYLNLRKARRENAELIKNLGNVTDKITDDGNSACASSSQSPEVSNTTLQDLEATNTNPAQYHGPEISTPFQDYTALLSENPEFMADTSDSESDDNKSIDGDPIVSVTLGADFIDKLDQLFGRQGFQYPDYIKPTVNMPMGLLREINAYWVESIAFQMDDVSRQTEEMIRQDGEFARQIATKEEQMALEGQEPDVPDFKEIMDMDIALSIYEKNVEERWRNNEPQDMAAKLSREKLFNLFPDVSQTTLSELLMAHENNFLATVESLLISTGEAHLLEEKNGVNKFVMQREMERKEKILEEENKALSETDWPFLSAPTDVTLETIAHYRDEAEKYLNTRNLNYNKARFYIDRNSPHIASFYSDIASYNTRRYEQASCMAAASLMQYHASRNPDNNILDLHFLRVVEAMMALEMFLDNKILKLRNQNVKSEITYIITGRGVHSPGMPRVKPATKRRLKDRAVFYKESNPGMLMVKIYATHKMSNELERGS